MWDMKTEVVHVTSLVPPNFCHSSTRGETFMYWSIYFSRCAPCACLPQLIMASSKVMLGTLMHVSKRVKVRVYNYTTCIVWNYWNDCSDCCMLCRPANSHGFIVGLTVLVLVSRSHRHTRKTRFSSTILTPTLLYLVWKVHIGDRKQLVTHQQMVNSSTIVLIGQQNSTITYSLNICVSSSSFISNFDLVNNPLWSSSMTQPL